MPDGKHLQAQLGKQVSATGHDGSVVSPGLGGGYLRLP
jgi:hypothetical protein